MEAETAKFKLLLGAIIVFVISIFWTWEEARYFLFSKKIAATITQEMLITRKRGDEVISRAVEVSYHYDLNGVGHDDKDSVSETFPLPDDRQGLLIQALSGKSRIKGNGSMVGPIIFFIALALLVGLSIPIWIASRNDRSPR